MNQKRYSLAPSLYGKYFLLITLVGLFFALVTPTSAFAQLRVPENPTSTAAGLDYRYYEGSYDVLPAFASLTALKTGTASSFEVTAVRQRDYAYALRYTGFVSVPTDGQYTFFTNSDDGSQLFIGSTLVVDNDGGHGTQERSGVIGLQAGTHAITVTYFQGGGGQSLEVSYQGPGLAKQTLPFTSLKRAVTSNTNSSRTSSVSTSSVSESKIVAEVTAAQSLDAAMWVYPNPSKGTFTVNYTADKAQGATISLIDELGRVVHNQVMQMQAGSNQLMVQTSGLAQGLYLLLFSTDDNQRQTQRMMLNP